MPQLRTDRSRHPLRPPGPSTAHYKNAHLDHCYQLDLVVAQTLILEIKAIDRIHEAPLLTYLRLSRLPVGLILNFHSVVLKDGIRRMVL